LNAAIQYLPEISWESGKICDRKPAIYPNAFALNEKGKQLDFLQNQSNRDEKGSVTVQT
jgi:hypothetical protein